MAYTHRASEVAAHLKELLEEADDLGLQDVFYGDQQSIPRSPAVVIENASVAREYSGAPYRTINTITVVIILYMAATTGIEEIQAACDELGEDIADVINTDAMPALYNPAGTQFGGLVINAGVILVEYGYAVKRNEILRANRLTIECLSKTAQV